MKKFTRYSLLGGLLLALSAFSATTYGMAPKPLDASSSRPNIIIILADDMGYGDLQAFNTDSVIPTPNLNKLADEGIRFTDAHTPSSICTPTRYGLLTGRYCWRTSMKKGVLRGYSPPLIEANRITIADYLKGQGYRTGIVGKWHLGLGWQQGKVKVGNAEHDFDLTKPLNVTPNDNGFDYSFIVPASLDFEPYLYIRDREVVDTNFEWVPTTSFPHFWREGIKSKSLEFVGVMDDLLGEAKGFIERESSSANPFFLYFPLTSPHMPVIPADRFIGDSKRGLYGDFIVQIDWTVGELMKLLEDLEIEENTIVIFTSDNGSPMRTQGTDAVPDHVTVETLRHYTEDHHKANGGLRGTKADIWEGGHRVPFIVRWPASVSAGMSVDETICLTDIFDTAVEITGGEKPVGNGEDSFSFAPLLYGKELAAQRPPIIHHSGGKAMFAIRDGDWKLILGNGSGGRTNPVGEQYGKPYQLYDLPADLAETKNLIDEKPELAKQLEAQFYAIKGED